MERFIISKTEIWAYISKTADATTIERVEKWIASSDYDEVLFTQIKTVYHHTSSDQSSSVAVAKERFFEKVNVKPTFNIFKNLYKYAAILVIAISGTYAYQYSSEVYSPIIVQTTYGEQKQIHLSDGSTVWLNASSKLSYTKKHPRTLKLEGEGFFEVAKDKKHPFTVTTADHITVKALGTSFNVKSYVNSAVTETKLLTGKVEISSDEHFDNKPVLIPNEKIVFFRKENKMIKSKMSLNERTIGWKSGKIQFKNKSFKEIALDLKTQFNIQIHFKNEAIANSRFSGSFDHTTPINEIFEILNYSKNFKYNLKTATNEWIIK